MRIWVKLVPDTLDPGLWRPPFPVPMDARRGLARPEDCVSVLGAPGDVRDAVKGDGSFATEHVLLEILDADAEKARPFSVAKSDVAEFDRQLVALVEHCDGRWSERAEAFFAALPTGTKAHPQRQGLVTKLLAQAHVHVKAQAGLARADALACRVAKRHGLDAAPLNGQSISPLERNRHV